MTTQYKHKVTIAVPAGLIPDANHLACLFGESADDINTFGTASYTDGTTEYAVSHAAVKAVFIEPTQTGTLPADPDHAPPEYDRAKAEAAFAAIAEPMLQPTGDVASSPEPGKILLAIDVDPHEQFAAWGLSRIPTEDALV